MNEHPVEVYEEKYWEVFDPWSAQVIAHFFDKRYADLFAAMINLER